MTTVAWDGKTLATDSQGTTEAGFKSRMTKLFVSADKKRAFAGTGSRAEIHELQDWLIRMNRDSDNRPTLTDDATHGIYVDEYGAYYVEGKRPVLIPVEDTVTGVGSGRNMAIAALRCGRTAEQAVLLAEEFDAWSSGPVQTWEAPESEVFGPIKVETKPAPDPDTGEHDPWCAEFDPTAGPIEYRDLQAIEDAGWVR
jgi:ATP-dependent protease HslVU (ClpYQ) peptidase subunit